MSTTNISSFRKNLFEYTENVIRFNDPLTITSKNGNFVVLSEEEYKGIMETLYLSSVPGMESELMRLKNTPSDAEEFIPESEVNWDV